jgi:hypothetical protein
MKIDQQGGAKGYHRAGGLHLLKRARHGYCDGGEIGLLVRLALAALLSLSR